MDIVRERIEREYDIDLMATMPSVRFEVTLTDGTETTRVLDELVGRALPGQLVSVGIALTAGIAAYALAVLALRVPEAQQIRDAVASRVRRRRS
jgi:hypothetical protein